MLNELSHKSSSAPAGAGRFPAYGWVGIAVIGAGEALLITGQPLVRQWFTPIMWTGYIMLMDALVRRRRGTSLVSAWPLEFTLLAVISIGSWLVFEGYNLLLLNWRYVGLPENPIARYFGYAWAFATISPGIFLTYDVLDCYLPGRSRPWPDTGGGSREEPASETPGSSDARRRASRDPSGRYRRSPVSPQLSKPVYTLFLAIGAISLLAPLILPSTWMTPLVWIGFAFFLDPINGRLGERSFLSEFFTGDHRSMPMMFLAGLVCGFLWEFWNYWASSKWHYDVPYLGHIRLFEMPVLGFLGFMPFAVESFAIYVFVRRLIPIRRKVHYLG